METAIAAVDLFCGAGGLTHGMNQEGIPVIAGVDLEEKGQPYVPKGATGFGARLLLQFVENWAKRN